jgi:hypothetical protein
MNYIFTENGLRIGRDSGDKAIRKESTVIFRVLKALNACETRGRWARFYPDRHGLTASKIGVQNRKRGIVYWHGNYAVEDAAEAWNGGQLFLNKA